MQCLAVLEVTKKDFLAVMWKLSGLGMESDDRQEALLRALQQRAVQQVQMGVVILSANRKDKYDCVKKYLCVDCPTPSQCVVARTLSRPQTLMTIATKISLQRNCNI
ncbi:piwi-like protein 1 [Ictalurus punctatus]|uniref:Piwi-like protein 1 n=1 Tax=Ictalurus punctatus TaxID=7998 RepID=A0A9F7RF73_ICTPU|nr:piwi-like protein 1 [Ictalurus punctatus]